MAATRSLRRPLAPAHRPDEQRPARQDAACGARETLEQKRFFEQALAGRVDLLGNAKRTSTGSGRSAAQPLDRITGRLLKW
jgi:hypothetical protein